MKKYLALAGIVGIFMFLGAQVTMPTRFGEPTVKSTKTFTASQVDTVRFIREPGLSGLSIAFHWKDSVSITSALLRRVINGKPTGFATADSIFTGAPILARDDTTVVRTITLTPLAEEYWAVVTYASSAQGVTSPTVSYILNRQYNK